MNTFGKVMTAVGANLRVRILRWGGEAKSSSQCSENGKGLESSGKVAWEMVARIKCLNAEGNRGKEGEAAGWVLKEGYQ